MLFLVLGYVYVPVHMLYARTRTHTHTLAHTGVNT